MGEPIQLDYETPGKKPNSQGALIGFDPWIWAAIILILVMAYNVLTPKISSGHSDAKIARAKADITDLKTAIETYQIDTGHYPSTRQGLQALVTSPGNEPNWKHSYMGTIPIDPWGNPYIYQQPGSNGNDYNVISAGKDGIVGTADDLRF